MVCSGGLYFDPVCQYFVFWMVYLYLSNCFYSGQAQAATSCVNTALTAKEGISWNCVSLTTVTNRSPIINYHINIRTVMVMVQHLLFTPSQVSIKCHKKMILARLFSVKTVFNCPILFTRLLWGDLQLQLALVDRLPRTPCTHRLHLTCFKFTLWPNSTFFLASFDFKKKVCLSSKYFSQTLVDATKHLTMFTPTANYTSYFYIFEQISIKENALKWA